MVISFFSRSRSQERRERFLSVPAAYIFPSGFHAQDWRLLADAWTQNENERYRNYAHMPKKNPGGGEKNGILSYDIWGARRQEASLGQFFYSTSMQLATSRGKSGSMEACGQIKLVEMVVEI